MAGIYIHIPFCRQACHYCNFHFSVSQRQKEGFLASLLKEIELRHDFFGKPKERGEKYRLDSVYLGGGTPSILSISELNRIFERLAVYFDFDPSAEITLEANPDDLTYEKLEALRQTPINRLSIGIQSFHAADLAYMNRVHSPGQAIQAIEDALKLGFENMTIDLIYGTPTMNDSQWRENLQRTIDFGIQHISAYALTVEPKTALDVFIRRGQAKPVEEEQSARQFEIMVEVLARHGYQHYEISNFALPEKFSRHNLSYWTGKPYLGLGPSAHSFRGTERSWNPPNTAKYIQSIQKGILPLESEQLTPAQQYDEYLMTSLRTMWGCDLNKVKEGWGEKKREELEKQTVRYVEQGLMFEVDHHLILTEKGRLFADRIASDLFWV
jgi:oxygen-independent coproporphyrinogen III oxidase